jgi:hypothetical protein
VYIAFRSFKNTNDQESLLKSFYLFNIISAVILFMQIPNLAHINDIIYSLYSPPRYQYGVSEYSIRAGLVRGVSTFYGANIYGAFLLMPIAYLLEHIIFAKLPRKYPYLLGLLSLTAATLLTQSRSAFAGITIILIGFTVFVLVSRVEEKKGNIKLESRSNVSRVVFLIIIVFLTILFLSSKLQLKRVFSFGEAFRSGSMRVKFQLWAENIEEVSKVNPLLGAGYNIELLKTWDNEYGYIFFYFGVVGLFLYFTFFAILLKSLLERKPFYYRALSLLLIAYLLLNFSETTLLCNRVGPFLMMLLGLAFSSEAKRTSIEAGEDRK